MWIIGLIVSINARIRNFKIEDWQGNWIVEIEEKVKKVKIFRPTGDDHNKMQIKHKG